MIFGRIGSFDSTHLHSNINTISSQISKSIQKLSSGNNLISKENPSSISYVERIKSAISGVAMGIKNGMDEILLMEQQKSEAVMKTDIMQRIKELGVSYKNDTLSDKDKEVIQLQVDELSKALTTNNSLSGMDEQLNSIWEKLDEIKKQVIDIQGENSLEVDDTLSLINNTTQTEHQYDLSKSGILDEIDASLEVYAGKASSLMASINSAEFNIDNLRKSQGLMEEQLTRLTATDFAEETVNLMKAKIQMGMNIELLDIQNNLEKNIVFSLLELPSTTY